jgi:hypothetical protein
MEELKNGFEIPEAQLYLNFKDRHGDKIRQIKHITQISTIHVNNHIFANQLKLLALLEDYVDAIDSNKTVGIYLYGRTIFELAAFLHDVTDRLLITKQITDIRWKDKGVEFFNTIIRARFGTSNSYLISLLQKGKISRRNTAPINVSFSISKLLSKKEHRRLQGKYDMLCDYVHHNFSSSTVSISGIRQESTARHSSGGAIRLPHKSVINVYSVDQSDKSNRAAEQTMATVVDCVAVCRHALSTIPESPYSKEFLTEMTGLSSGFMMFPPRIP